MLAEEIGLNALRAKGMRRCAPSEEIAPPPRAKLCTHTHKFVDARKSVCMITHMQSRVVISKIEAAGWVQVRSRGSHRQFKHPTLPGLVTVPHPKKDLPTGTLRSIERQSGVTLVEE